MNKIHAKNAGPTSESDGRPSARIANVICPANETESTMDCVRNDQRETREMPAGVRERSVWRERRIRRRR
jgi:hypothetical protein